MRDFGEMTFVSTFGKKAVMPLTPGAFEQILINKNGDFANQPAWEFLIGLSFRRGILLMDFEEHRAHRRILQKAFSNTNLKGYMQSMQPALTERVARIPAGQVRIFDEIKKIALDMALEVFVGVTLPADEAGKLNEALLDCLKGTSAIVRAPVPGGNWRRAMRGRRYLEEFFYSQIPYKRRHETPDLFSVLCHVADDDGNMFTDDDIVNHMIFVLFAAHDTSTTATGTMIYHLGRHQDWQRRARDEALSLPAELAFEHLRQLPVHELIFREGLRLNSPVPVFARQTVRDTNLQGYHVPEGTVVMAAPFNVHLNPTVWTDPTTFDPDRFSAERSEDSVHRFAWMPFGGGVHKCIGLYFAQMEIKLIMHALLRNFDWSVSADYEFRIERGTLGEPRAGLPATLTRRPDVEAQR